ncbi:MAG: hypothetical protein NTU98_10765 [Bacteroidetes bacterium]|nr:hypothetical protein [Bacteroidota bacterium]
MKKLFVLLFIFMLAHTFSFSQKIDSTVTTSTKPNQSMLKNEIYGGYGAASVYYFLGRLSHPYQSSQLWLIGNPYSNPESLGTIYIGYSRKFSKVVSMGIVIGYQKFSYTGNVARFTYSDYKWTTYSGNFDDRLITGITKVTFHYHNKPKFSIYSAIWLGVTLDLGTLTYNGEHSVKNVGYPACQLTFVGFRFGRDFGGFLELGAGTLGIVNAGLSYKFTQQKERKHRADTTVKVFSVHSPAVKYNDLYAGYGILSVYHDVGKSGAGSRYNFDNPQSSGSFHLGYLRTLNNVFSVGCDLGYEDFHYGGTESINYNHQDTIWAVNSEDQLFTGIATVQLTYINKPFIRLYSRLGVGISIDAYTGVSPIYKSTEILKRPAFQVTLIGLRVGRAFGGFAEFGYGFTGIVSAGLSYRFAGKKKHE